MKNKCKHRQKVFSLTLKANTRYNLYTDIFWCSLCGATRYHFTSSDLNKRYGRWKSPRNIVRTGSKI